MKNPVRRGSRDFAFRRNGQTDRHDEINRFFFLFCERAQKALSQILKYKAP